MDKKFYNIKNKIDDLEKITSWSDKYKEIQEIKKEIEKRRKKLLALQEKLGEEIKPNNEEFDNFNLDKVLEQINKSNSIEKQVNNLLVLKEWFVNEKDKVSKE